MNKYRKLQFAALAVEFVTLLVWGCRKVADSLPDWVLRLNGVIMLAAVAVLVFASVRLLKKG